MIVADSYYKLGLGSIKLFKVYQGIKKSWSYDFQYCQNCRSSSMQLHVHTIRYCVWMDKLPVFECITILWYKLYIIWRNYFLTSAGDNCNSLNIIANLYDEEKNQCSVIHPAVPYISSWLVVSFHVSWWNVSNVWKIRYCPITAFWHLTSFQSHWSFFGHVAIFGLNMFYMWGHKWAAATVVELQMSRFQQWDCVIHSHVAALRPFSGMRVKAASSSSFQIMRWVGRQVP